MVSIVTILVSAILIILSFIIGLWIGQLYTKLYILPRLKKQALKQSKAVIGGQVSEHIAPLLPYFPANISDIKFIGQPVDYIAFNGLAQRNVTSITFIEVKANTNTISPIQKQIQTAIQNKQVDFKIYTTNKKNKT